MSDRVVLRDYQVAAVRDLVRARRGMVKAPAGSGKTIIGAAAIARWSGPRARFSGRRMRVAWVANTLEQCEQAHKALGAFEIDADVVVACYAGLPSLAVVDLVLLDECQHIAAPEYRKILTDFAGWRWGVSATPTREDETANDVYELIGQIVHEVPRQALVQAGQLAKAKLVMHQPNVFNEMKVLVAEVAAPLIEERLKRFAGMIAMGRMDAKEQASRALWQVALDLGIEGNRLRNNKIVALAKEHVAAADSVLTIVGKISHGEALAARVPSTVVCHSKMGRKNRKEAIEAFKAGELRHLIATSLADEGLDVPRANVLILAATGRSKRLAEQRTGRVLRSFQDKTHGLIHDFMDVQHHFLLAQSKQRMAIYRQLGYEVVVDASQPELEGVSHGY